MARTSLTNILCAEDEPDIRKLVKISLETLGKLTVEFCQDGIELMSKVLVFKPDLIILDALMPRMNGLMTHAELQKNPQTKNIPIIFMTASVQASEISTFLKLDNVIDVICKPFDAIHLADIIKASYQRYIDNLPAISE